MISILRPTPLHLLGYATSFAMVGVCTALALQGGSTPLTVVTLRALGTIAIFLAYFRLAGVSLAMTGRERAIATAIGVPLCVNTYSINLAISEIPVPLVVLIFYLWPAITTTASWLLRSERFHRRGLLGLVLAFAGVALALDVDFTAAQAEGVWLALVSAFTWSLVFLLTHHFFRGRDTRPMMLHMTLMAAVVFALISLATGTFTLPDQPAGWTGLAGIAFFYAFGMIGVFAATVRLGPMRTGFFMNFEPIASVLLSALILSQTLEPVQLAGAALVIAALFLFRPPVAALALSIRAD